MIDQASLSIGCRTTFLSVTLAKLNSTLAIHQPCGRLFYFVLVCHFIFFFIFLFFGTFRFRHSPMFASFRDVMEPELQFKKNRREAWNQSGLSSLGPAAPWQTRSLLCV
ncbi:hypothetical protein I7I50_01186 [Histoplasma capsulatum G186AR]|uniref:Uncharacterized protein n=1 Tax=Ajellomyces capsulatus TaxID=5037 RepID=A0A8H7YUN0_AJECA|nr:hypothetical protein I7I52_08986 [Histoplasma capsulatum]QSS73136.1 hypothetical protein I7I50_01186 [Histoplasma capsulatum G186AR]